MALGNEALMPVKRSKTEYPKTKTGVFNMLKSLLPEETLPNSSIAQKKILKIILTKYYACFDLQNTGIWVDEKCINEKRDEMLKLFDEMYLFSTKF